MSNLTKFLRMDNLTVKPYLTFKTLLVYFACAIIITVSTRTGSAVSGLIMMLCSIFVSYPFVVGEKSNMDALYVTLSVDRRTVVLGRYIFALIFDISALAFGLIFQIIIFKVMKIQFNLQESLTVILLIFAVFSVFQLIQIPIFFKLGYTKAKLVTYIPLVGFGAAAGFYSYIGEPIREKLNSVFVWGAENPFLGSLILLGIWISIVFISYRLSLTFYSKREF